MPSFLTNLAWPNRRADLSGSTADGYVIGYQVVGGLNQQWTNVAGGTIQSGVVGPGGAPVIVGVNPATSNTVHGGGPENNFVIGFVGGGITIMLPGNGGDPDLYWTLDNDDGSTPVRVRAAGGPGGAPGENQIWTLTAA